MSTVEYYKVKEADVSISEFVRASIMKSSVVQHLTPKMKEDNRKKISQVKVKKEKT